MTKPTYIEPLDPNNFSSRVVLRTGTGYGRKLLMETLSEGYTAQQGRAVAVLYDHHITLFEGIKSSELHAFREWAVALWSAHHEADAERINASWWWDGVMVRLDYTD